jgi:hypothetical protein
MTAATMKNMITSRVKNEFDPMIYHGMCRGWRLSEDDKKSTDPAGD